MQSPLLGANGKLPELKKSWATNGRVRCWVTFFAFGIERLMKAALPSRWLMVPTVVEALPRFNGVGLKHGGVIGRGMGGGNGGLHAPLLLCSSCSKAAFKCLILPFFPLFKPFSNYPNDRSSKEGTAGALGGEGV